MTSQTGLQCMAWIFRASDFSGSLIQFGSIKLGFWVTCISYYFKRDNCMRVHVFVLLYKCTQSVTWHCIHTVVDCGQPQPLNNGQINTSSGTTYLSVATYSCAKGYWLNGPTTRTCTVAGIWSHTTPSCDREFQVPSYSQLKIILLCIQLLIVEYSRAPFEWFCWHISRDSFQQHCYL